MYRERAYSVVRSAIPKTGFKVQGMLLMAIVDHAHGYEMRSLQTLRGAVNLALELGMNRATFACENSHGSPVFEECWRRTYWELYVVTGVIAAMGSHEPFALQGLVSNAKLPCDEAVYAAANVSPVSLRILYCG